MSRPSPPLDRRASIIMEATHNGDFEKFKSLLGENNLDFATPTHNRTPLHVAAMSGNLNVVNWIVRRDDPVSGEVMNAKDVFGYTPLHLAVHAKHEEIVQCLLSTPETDTFAVASNMQRRDEVRRHNDFVPLHFAARQGFRSIVNMLLEHHPKCRADKYQPVDLILMKSRSRKTSLHYAAEQGHWHVVSDLLGAVKNTGIHQVVNCLDIWRQTPLHLATFNQSMETVEILLREGEGLKVNATTWEGITALDMAKKRGNQKIVQMLENFDVSWLQADRQKYANAANSILVGAALIAGATYASWLQPPLGLVPYYGLPVPSAPPDTYESFVAVKQHWELQLFWVFNSCSFFFSTATLVIGAAAGIPRQCTYLREEVAELRSSVVVASYLLSAAIAFIIAAFCIAGTLVLPPIQKYRITMYVCVPLGALFCSVLLFQYVRKVWRWSLSPSLRYTRHPAPESSSDAHNSEVNLAEQSGIYTTKAPRSNQEQIPNGGDDPSSSFFFETEGRQINAIFRQVERRLQGQETNRQSLPLDLGTFPLSSDSLRSTRTNNPSSSSRVQNLREARVCRPTNFQLEASSHGQESPPRSK